MLPPSRRLPYPCLDEPDLPSTATNWTLPDSHWLDGPDGRLSGRSFGGAVGRGRGRGACRVHHHPSRPLACPNLVGTHPSSVNPHPIPRVPLPPTFHVPRPSSTHALFDATELPLGPRLRLQQGETGTQPELGSSNSSCFSLDLRPPIHLSSLGPAALLLIVRPSHLLSILLPSTSANTRTREILRRVSKPRSILLSSTRPALGPSLTFVWPDLTVAVPLLAPLQVPRARPSPAFLARACLSRWTAALEIPPSSHSHPRTRRSTNQPTQDPF
jgi:hypothetical protein